MGTPFEEAVNQNVQTKAKKPKVSGGPNTAASPQPIPAIPGTVDAFSAKPQQNSFGVPPAGFPMASQPPAAPLGDTEGGAIGDSPLSRSIASGPGNVKPKPDFSSGEAGNWNSRVPGLSSRDNFKMGVDRIAEIAKSGPNGSPFRQPSTQGGASSSGMDSYYARRGFRPDEINRPNVGPSPAASPFPAPSLSAALQGGAAQPASSDTPGTVAAGAGTQPQPSPMVQPRPVQAPQVPPRSLDVNGQPYDPALAGMRQAMMGLAGSNNYESIAGLGNAIGNYQQGGMAGQAQMKTADAAMVHASAAKDNFFSQALATPATRAMYELDKGLPPGTLESYQPNVHPSAMSEMGQAAYVRARNPEAAAMYQGEHSPREFHDLLKSLHGDVIGELLHNLMHKRHPGNAVEQDLDSSLGATLAPNFMTGEKERLQQAAETENYYHNRNQSRATLARRGQ